MLHPIGFFVAVKFVTDTKFSDRLYFLRQNWEREYGGKNKCRVICYKRNCSGRERLGDVATDVEQY